MSIKSKIEGGNLDLGGNLSTVGTLTTTGNLTCNGSFYSGYSYMTNIAKKSGATTIEVLDKTSIRGGLDIKAIVSGSVTAGIDQAGVISAPTTLTTNTTGGSALLVSASGLFGIATSLRDHKMNIDYTFDPNFIYKLKPCKYQYKKILRDEEGKIIGRTDKEPENDYLNYGLIAEDTEPINGTLCTYDKDNKLSGVRYEQIAPVLIKCIQDLKKEIDILKIENAAIKTKLGL